MLMGKMMHLMYSRSAFCKRAVLNTLIYVKDPCPCSRQRTLVTSSAKILPSFQYHTDRLSNQDVNGANRRGNKSNVLCGRRVYLCSITPSRGFSRQSFVPYLSVDFPPISLIYQTLEYVHTNTGLPWWGTIALTTFALRVLVTLPLAVYSTRIISKVECLQPEIAQLAKELKGEVDVAVHRYKWNSTVAKYHYVVNLRRHIRNLYIRDNCHPFKASLVVWVQIPLWISFSLALRNMAGVLPILGTECKVLSPDLATEGALWFSNLLLADTTLLLPVIVAILNLANVELYSLRRENPGRFSNILTNVLRCVSVLMIPIGASVPSCMCLYWTCSSLMGLIQNLVLRVPSVRSVLPIPQTPGQSDTPFMDMYRIAKKRYSWRKKKKVPTATLR